MDDAPERRQQILSSLRSFLSEEGSSDAASIEDDENLFDAGVIDSMRLVTLIGFIQDEYALDFDFAELTEQNFASLSSMCRFIVEKQQQAV
jgi:acyl carrier protein